MGGVAQCWSHIYTTVDEDPEADIAMTGVGVHSQHCGRGHQQLDCWAP